MESAGGNTLSELYQSGRRLMHRARDGVARLERMDASSSSMADLAGVVKKDVTQIQSLCFDMDRLWRSIPNKPQRDLWKRKVEQLGEEVDSLNENVSKHLMRQQRKLQEAQERTELLQRANGESSHVMRISDEENQAVESARNSSIMLEEAYSTGVAILSRYSDQRDRLKSAQRKALDVLNTVGLSNRVLKLIERRHRVDKWIAYGGMILVILVVYLFWKLTH